MVNPGTIFGGGGLEANSRDHVSLAAVSCKWMGCPGGGPWLPAIVKYPDLPRPG